jgi:hypothetical protein
MEHQLCHQDLDSSLDAGKLPLGSSRDSIVPAACWSVPPIQRSPVSWAAQTV